jgi:hypothetical protein
LHEVETSDDDAVLIREAACQSPDSARDEYTGLRVDKELRHRIGYRADALLMAVRPIEAQGPSPVVLDDVSGSFPTTSSMKVGKIGLTYPV